MIREFVTRQDVVDFLNEMLVLDAEATTRLCLARTPCNDALVGHSALQVMKIGEAPDSTAVWGVGLIGVLNGLFGADTQGRGDISMIVADYAEDDSMKVIGFKLLGRS